MLSEVESWFLSLSHEVTTNGKGGEWLSLQELQGLSASMGIELTSAEVESRLLDILDDTNEILFVHYLLQVRDRHYAITLVHEWAAV